VVAKYLSVPAWARAGGGIRGSRRVAWCNTRRLLEPLGYVPPDEFEREYYNGQTADAELARLT